MAWNKLNFSIVAKWQTGKISAKCSFESSCKFYDLSQETITVWEPNQKTVMEMDNKGLREMYFYLQ